VAAALAAATLAPPVTLAATQQYRVGQRCNPHRQRTYQAKGFKCVKRGDTYRLKRQGMTF
jgi:hypothetical protein